MTRSSSWAGAWALLALLAACSESRPPLAVGRIGGQVVFETAIEGATVELLPASEDGAVTGPAIATVQTDATGHFVFEGLRNEASTLVVRAHLAGASRPAGQHGDTQLRSLVVGHRQHTVREVPAVVTPWSTLTLAAADARRVAGWTDPVGSARAAMAAHLGFDPLETPVAAAPGMQLDDPRRHLLVTDGFERLAQRVADTAGVPRHTSITAVELLRALVADARGGPEPGRIDGIGADGPIALGGGQTYALSGETLRGELADAIGAMLVDTPDWTVIQPAAIQALLARLRCASAPASDLFGPCQQSEACDDVTAPVIGALVPADGETVSGVIELFAPVEDAESAVRGVSAQLANGAMLPERPARPRYTFELDTTTLSGSNRLEVKIVATNACGLQAERRATYTVDNRGVGTLIGHVIKGPARHTAVRVYQLVGVTPSLVAEGRTDADGAFAVEVPETEGALLVEALAAEDGQSVYLDEARGLMAWGERGRLRAVLPAFDSSAAEPARITVSPFTDLAWTIAERRARSGEAAPVAAYREALTAFGALFGLNAPFAALQSGVPLAFDTPSADRSMNDPTRMMLGLACLSQQALDLASGVFPDNPDLFTALDLVALYRVDAEDGYLDGWTQGGDAVSVEIEGAQIVLPADPMRGGLAEACVRWVGSAHNETGYNRGDVSLWLEELAQATGPLFNPEQAPRPLDVEAPEIAVTVSATDDGVVDDRPLGIVEDDTLTGPLNAIRGADGIVRVDVEVNDPVGVEAVTLRLGGGLPEDALTVVQAGPVGEGTATRYRIEAHLDTTVVPEGLVWVRCEAADRLGNQTARALGVRVDRQGPVIDLTRPPGMHPDGAGWVTREARAHQVPFSVADASPVSVRALVDGVEVGAWDEADAIAILRLDTWPGDEERVFSVEAIDSLGHRSVERRTTTLDRIAPEWVVDTPAFADERALPPSGEVDGVPTLSLSPEFVVDVARWQTHWAEDALNPATASLRASDRAQPCAGQCTARWRQCLGAECASGDARFENGAVELHIWSSPEGEPTLGNLGFDPWDAPPAPGTPASIEFVFSDRAGNTSAPVRFDVAITVLPPALEIVEDRWQAQIRHQWDVEELDWATFSIESTADNIPVRLMSWRISNPHDVAVTVGAGQAPDSAEMRFEYGRRSVVRRLDQILLTLLVPPECADVPDQVFPASECGVCNSIDLTGCMCDEAMCQAGLPAAYQDQVADVSCRMVHGGVFGRPLPAEVEPGESINVDYICGPSEIELSTPFEGGGEPYSVTELWYRRCIPGGFGVPCALWGDWLGSDLTHRLVSVEATLDEGLVELRQMVGDVAYDRSDFPQPTGFRIERE